MLAHRAAPAPRELWPGTEWHVLLNDPRLVLGSQLLCALSNLLLPKAVPNLGPSQDCFSYRSRQRQILEGSYGQR